MDNVIGVLSFASKINVIIAETLAAVLTISIRRIRPTADTRRVAKDEMIKIQFNYCFTTYY